ncbi:hypothetical protein L6164_023686 [Bauhinia variegata]|uniref:Uncharacterized protein n=1 Tax=Bauhinia variegata TaxID=167791 RepID=A0ACB9MKC7_BAUVA|nr:hypothetical protein L6164_023686 [Bauhinia variegata]
MGAVTSFVGFGEHVILRSFKVISGSRAIALAHICSSSDITKPLTTNPFAEASRVPTLGFFKLNRDGSSIGKAGRAAVGGLIRDSTGNWIKGFTNIHAEADALRLGLQLAWDVGIRNMEVNIDCKDLFHLLDANVAQHHKHGAPLSDIISILSWNWTVHISHAYIETNLYADKLATTAAKQGVTFMVLDTPPTWLHYELLADFSAVSSLRV